MVTRIATYNVGGGRKDFEDNTETICEMIRNLGVDIVALQEAVSWRDADDLEYSIVRRASEATDLAASYFHPSLTLTRHMHVLKKGFRRAYFADYGDWMQGLALLSRGSFTRLSEPSKIGSPRPVLLSEPVAYRGNRDTEPRHAIVARIGQGPIFPFVVNLHLTTLLGERPSSSRSRADPRVARRELVARGRTVRAQQAERLLILLRDAVLDRGLPAVVVGDFNAPAAEECVAMLESKGGFKRLVPEKSISTHPKFPEPIDHILVYPSDRLARYECRVVDTPVARMASDHLPVVAEIEWSDE